MTDDEFFSSFSDCSLPPAHFNHLGHVRLGWICLQRHAPDQAIALACDGIARYAAHLGAADKFHRTLTEALMRMLLAEGAADRGVPWSAFEQRAVALLADARALLARHYSPALLARASARRQFAAPDLLPLPC
jgi:hypothetical protein